MKRRDNFLQSILALVLVFLFLTTQEAAQNSSSQEKSPTLKETLDWLKEKLTAYASFTETLANRDTVQKVDLVSFDGCTLNYRYVHRAASIGLELQQIITFSLGDIDPSKLKLDGKDGHFTLTLYTVDSKPKIKVELKSSFARPLKEQSKWTDSARFPFDNLDMADRVSKAFLRAIDLCKGEKELFPSTMNTPETLTRSDQKPDKQPQPVKGEAVKMPVTILSISLHDTANPKFQSTNSGWCFMKLRNDDPARTISQVKVRIIIRDTMRDIVADRLNLTLEGRVKPLKVGEVSVSLGRYYLPNKWAFSYVVERIRFEDGSEWKLP